MPHITTVRVRANDSDIFFILLFYVKLSTVKIIFDIGDRLININKVAEEYSHDHTSALLVLHAFTGADCTSAFKGRGKVRPLKLISEHPKFIELFSQIGTTWECDNDTLS